MNTSVDKHEVRLQRWQLRVPEKTRFLSKLLISRLAPMVDAQSFARVGFELSKPERPVEGSELRFERETASGIDIVYVFFDKYSSPRFQLGFSRRAVSKPDTIVRAGYLVRRASEYYHEWGKPRWMPLVLWSESQAHRCVDEVAHRLPQVFSFLETGERGTSISRLRGNER